jgi:ADP-heptose:LPS heptosyltransferase
MADKEARKDSIFETRKILLCLRYGIGDLIMETPALDALRRAAPEARIFALGARPAIELLKDDPRVDEVVCVQDWGFEHWGDPGTPETRGRFRAWMDNEGFDLVLDPSHAVMGVAETIRSCCVSVRDAGSGIQERVLLQGRRSVAAIRAAVRAGWEIEVPESLEPQLSLQGADHLFAENFLASHEIGEDSIVGVSPVASSPLKRWPLEHFSAVVEEMSQSFGRVLLFIGPQDDAGALIAGRLRDPRTVIPVGPLHLRRVAALLYRCRLFIGNDTGLMHMAAAVGTPLVAIFGPTSPSIYLPRQVPAFALGANRPCPRRRTDAFGPPECVTAGRCLEGDRSCIDSVDSEDVLKVAHILHRSGGGRCGGSRRTIEKSL